jgi:hypothetical protein
MGKPNYYTVHKYHYLMDRMLMSRKKGYLSRRKKALCKDWYDMAGGSARYRPWRPKYR